MLRAMVDLPTPLGPTTTALPASLRKSSAISASMAARSQRVGHDQSKSASGLKRPILASLSRRSRLRRARSVSSQSSKVAAQPASWRFGPVGQEAMEAKALGALTQGLTRRHRSDP